MSEARRFFDTNILVYAFDQRDPRKRALAQTLLGATAQEQVAVMSYQVWQEFVSVATRKFRVKADVLDVMLAFEAFTESMQMIHSSGPMFTNAIRLWNRYSLAWYDALILAAALEARCGILYSEDLQEGLEIDGMRIVNPFR